MDWSVVDYCDVFISCLDSHSDGTHSLLRIHYWASDVMLHNATFLQICSHEETNASTSWMTWGWLQFQLFFFFGVNCSFKSGVMSVSCREKTGTWCDCFYTPDPETQPFLIRLCATNRKIVLSDPETAEFCDITLLLSHRCSLQPHTSAKDFPSVCWTPVTRVRCRPWDLKQPDVLTFQKIHWKKIRFITLVLFKNVPGCTWTWLREPNSNLKG